ncbi:role in replication [Streptococcus pyogenes]|nr:role in replication [Streptococcus pyogenes]
MLTLYKRQIAEVWEIGRETPQPEWVRDAFRKNYICWLDEHVRILMTGLNPSLTTNLKISATGTVGGGFAGYGMYVLGYPGDFLDVTNHRVISAKNSIKNIRLLMDRKSRL